MKDILLVVSSVLIWSTTVTFLQLFGYSIALGGLVYYKLGADMLKEYFSQGSRMWADYGVKHPAMRKAIIFGIVILVLLFLLNATGSNVVSNFDPTGYLSNSRLGAVLGKEGQ